MDFKDELRRIESLMTKTDGVIVESTASLRSNYYSVYSYVQKYSFIKWGGRHTCVSVDDLYETIRIHEILQSNNPSEEQVLTYLEFVSNMLYILSEDILRRDGTKTVYCKLLPGAMQNIKIILDYLNYEQSFEDSRGIVILVSKNAAATAVVEYLDDDIGIEILRYNHFLLKGDIGGKRDILLRLGNLMEPLRNQIKELDKKLEDDCFYMLNNLNIRHNNLDETSKYYKPGLKDVPDNIMEKWYDLLYDKMLVAYLLIQNKDKSNVMSDIKACVDTD